MIAKHAIIDSKILCKAYTYAFCIPMSIQFVFPVILIPSPRRLLRKGQVDRARNFLCALLGSQPYLVEKEMPML